MAVVVHSGSGLNRGHYISLVKSDGIWLLFDDEYVDVSLSILRLLPQIFFGCVADLNPEMPFYLCGHL